MKKRTLILMFTALTLLSTAHARGLIGTNEKYVINGTNQIIEVASNDIEDGVASYRNADGERVAIAMSGISKEVDEMSGLSAGDNLVVTTNVRFSKTLTTTRYCTVFSVFANNSVSFGCNTIEADRDSRIKNPNRSLPTQLNYFSQNAQDLTKEVPSLQGFQVDEEVIVEIDAGIFNEGQKVQILTIFADGHAIIKKSGIDLFDNSKAIIHKHNIAFVQLSDLKKQY